MAADFEHMAHLEVRGIESFGVGGRKDRTETYILRGTPEQLAEKVRKWVESSLHYESRTQEITVRPVNPMDVIELNKEESR